jgi:hypothetical protein
MRKVNQPLKMENVRLHRREDCVHYEVCLEEASALMWPSFSCEGCRFFARKEGGAIPRYERAASPLAWEV